MSTLTADQVRHIAKLARLELTDEEVTKFTTELTSILAFIDQLGEVKTDGVTITQNPTGLRGISREDVVKKADASPDALLGCSSLPIVDHQIQTPSAHG